MVCRAGFPCVAKDRGRLSYHAESLISVAFDGCGNPDAQSTTAQVVRRRVAYEKSRSGKERLFQGLCRLIKCKQLDLPAHEATRQPESAIPGTMAACLNERTFPRGDDAEG